MKREQENTGQPDQGETCRLKSSQTNLTFTIMDVFKKEHCVYAQTGEDGKIRVLTLPSEGIQISPSAIEELAKLIRNASVTITLNK